MVDVQRGTVGKARLGDSRRELGAKLGRPVKEGREIRLYPLDSAFPEAAFPGRAAGRKPLILWFRGVSVVVSARRGTVAFYVWRPRARTPEGIRIGDDMAATRERYDDLTCSGDEIVECSRSTRGRSLWFAGERIESITLTRGP